MFVDLCDASPVSYVVRIETSPIDHAVDLDDLMIDLLDVLQTSTVVQGPSISARNDTRSIAMTANVDQACSEDSAIRLASEELARQMRELSTTVYVTLASVLDPIA